MDYSQMQAPPDLLQQALARRRDTQLAPTQLFRQQAVEPNRLSELGQLYINVDNADVMDSLQPFVELLPNHETAMVHQRFSNTAENREQMLLACVIQLKREIMTLRDRIFRLENPNR